VQAAERVAVGIGGTGGRAVGEFAVGAGGRWRLRLSAVAPFDRFALLFKEALAHQTA
jgi:hypothetical protein